VQRVMIGQQGALVVVMDGGTDEQLTMLSVFVQRVCRVEGCQRVSGYALSQPRRCVLAVVCPRWCVCTGSWGVCTGMCWLLTHPVGARQPSANCRHTRPAHPAARGAKRTLLPSNPPGRERSAGAHGGPCWPHYMPRSNGQPSSRCSRRRQPGRQPTCRLRVRRCARCLAQVPHTRCRPRHLLLLLPTCCLKSLCCPAPSAARG
jgi:hypothetical protein